MYKGLNANYEIMQSPYFCTMPALTFIKGPLVKDWATNQVKILEEKVNCQINPLSTTDPTSWTDFVTALDRKSVV